jgi:hypothetical protein
MMDVASAVCEVNLHDKLKKHHTEYYQALLNEQDPARLKEGGIVRMGSGSEDVFIYYRYTIVLIDW